MTLLQFEVFIKVVELKSFTKASEQLGYTQSAVSQMVKSLEEELNVNLLERSRSGLKLTIIGERMLKHMREIIKIEKTMQQEAYLFNGINAGSIKIGVTPSVSTKLLPMIVGSFRKKFPHIDLIIFESTASDINQLITNEEIDLGFTILGNQQKKGHIPIYTDQLMVLLPPEHTLIGEESITIEQIIESCFIMPKGDCDNLISQLFARSHLKPKIRYEIQDTSTIIAMVGEGIALTILPELAIPKETLGVKLIPLEPIEKRNIGFIIKDLQSIPPGVAEFINHARNSI
ncbi:LysR family transcriptional regulator [Cytobacillus suaedae]|nr:LysR family transcriptional regulator [Cytobacillus suaedae]